MTLRPHTSQVQPVANSAMASVARHQLFVILGLCVCSLTAASSRPPPSSMDTLSHRIRSLENRLYEGVKRSCDGFPCMYSHLGAKAGRQALMRTLMSIIDGCAVDPHCSPGRRRRKRKLQYSLQGAQSQGNLRSLQ